WSRPLAPHGTTRSPLVTVIALRLAPDDNRYPSLPFAAHRPPASARPPGQNHPRPSDGGSPPPPALHEPSAVQALRLAPSAVERRVTGADGIRQKLAGAGGRWLPPARARHALHRRPGGAP